MTRIKIENIPLCRLRQTCSSMDRFIEANRRELSRRPQLSVNLFFARGIRQENNEEPLPDPDHICVYKCKERHLACDYVNFASTLEFKELSAIAIKKLNIGFGNNLSVAQNETLLSILRGVRPTCDWAKVFGVPLATLIEIADLVECRGKISFQMSHNEFSFDNFVILVTALRKHPKCHNFKVSVSELTRCPIDDLFPLFKPFRAGLIHNCTTESFHRLLFEIVKSRDVGNLEKLSCEFWDHEVDRNFWPFDHHEVENPPFSVLWDVAWLPSNFRVIDLCKIYEDSDVMHDWIVPFKIRLVDLRTKFAVIVESQEGAIIEEEIHFVQKDSAEVLKLMVRELRIGTAGESFVEEYLAADEERRGTLLAAEFVYSAIREEMNTDNL